MPAISYIKKIRPIASFDEFGDKLARMATPVLDETDPLIYFSDKIEVMENFALGIYQWAIVDFANQYLYEIGGMLEEMTGQSYEYWKGASPEKYVSELALAEHIPYWMAYIQFIYSYILQNQEKSFHPQLYLKMKNKDGVYRNVVMQFIDWKQESDGGVRFCLCQITDISHVQIDEIPQMSILITENGNTKLLRSRAPNLIPGNTISLPNLTVREKEVIRLLAAGLTSKLIADKLGIAKNTVENYRQRLLKKTNSFTSSEVIAYAINNGLI